MRYYQFFKDPRAPERSINMEVIVASHSITRYYLLETQAKLGLTRRVTGAGLDPQKPFCLQPSLARRLVEKTGG
jgi:hypothetical protein